ncbi:caspase recruitment domain-containing protein 19 isoform 2-T2 [Geothlypis trichas]
MGTPVWVRGGSGGTCPGTALAAPGPALRFPSPHFPHQPRAREAAPRAGRPAPSRPGRKAEGRRPKAAARGPGGAGAAMAVVEVYNSLTAGWVSSQAPSDKMRDQSYCHRLQHDMYFLTSTSRLNEQVVDKIVLQLNRVYPQILTNEEAEKFRNPKASLHTRLSDLLKHLQKKGDRHCQEFYRALQINAEQLFNDLPSRKILSPVFFLACFSVAAGLALFWYCCNSETQVIGRARRILGFSPIIIGRHVRNICMLYLEDVSRN